MKTFTNGELLYAKIMDDLHKHWTPHEGQLEIGKAMYQKDIKNIFVQCGRKFGKSEWCIYVLWRHALLNPGSACYYLSPQQKQSKEIIWSGRRLQEFGAPRNNNGHIIPGDLNPLKKYIKKIDNTEMRIVFNNGSFIKVDGSDNYESYRGITPDFVVYDEFKDFNPKFHEGMEPNRAVRNAPLVIIGTPPDRECQYTVLADEYKERGDSFWIRRSSFSNPYTPKTWLQTEKQKLVARGETDVWEREYEAKFIRGGASSIFPMLDLNKHVKPHNELIVEIRRDLKKMEWFCITDPGTTTCFAALIGCVNPFTRKVYILDEIYETDQQNTTSTQIYPRMESIMRELYPMGDIDDDWFKVYDEAAAWFSAEIMHQYSVYFSPTQKHLNKKEHGLSLIKDLLLHEVVLFSDRCNKLTWEMENYVKDDKGNIPKKDDHLIDCFRYFLAAANYDMVEVKEAIRKKSDRRGYSLQEDLDNLEMMDDWTSVNWEE